MDAAQVVFLAWILPAALLSLSCLALLAIVWHTGKNAPGAPEAIERDEERYRQELEKLQRRMKKLADRKLAASTDPKQRPKRLSGESRGA